LARGIGDPDIFLTYFAKRTPLQAPANGSITVTHLEFLDLSLPLAGFTLDWIARKLFAK
jgi:hypothetical protein